MNNLINLHIENESNKNINMNTNLLTNKIKIFLFNLGLNERYNATHYLTFLLVCMVKYDDSTKSYKNYLLLCKERFNLSIKSIAYSLTKLLQQSENNIFINENKQIKYSLYKKIKLLKTTFINNFLY